MIADGRSGGGEGERESERERERFKDGTHLKIYLKMEEGDTVNGFRHPLAAGKNKKMLSSLEVPGGMRLCQHFDFSFIQPMADF